MKPFKLAGTIPALAFAFSAGIAGAATLGTPTTPTVTNYVFKSTNADNFADGTNWVELVSAGPGSVELKFTNQNAFGAWFEFRVDNAPATSITPHYLLASYTGDSSLYPFYSVAAGTVRIETIAATSFVDVRHAFGPEQDVHFDWTRFETAAPPIPLPAAGWLLLSAFGGLGLVARRRRKAA